MGIGFDVTNKLINNASSSMMDAASVINSVAANIAAPRGGSSCAFSSHSEREAFMNYCQAQGAQVSSVKFGNDYVVSFGGDTARAEQLMNSFRNEHGGGSMHSFDSSQYKTNAQYSSITHTLVSGSLSAARGYTSGVSELINAGQTVKSVGMSLGMMATGSPNIIRAAASRACSDIASYRVKGGLSQSNAHYDAVHVIGGQVFLRGQDVTNTELGTRALQMHAQRNNDARAITGSDHDLARSVTRDVMHDAEVSGREEREAIERQARQIVDSNYGYNESAYIIADSMALKDGYSSYSATGDTYLSSLQDIQTAMRMDPADINAGNLSGDSLDYLKQNDTDLYNSLSGGGTVSLTFEERMNAQKVVNSFESSMFTMSAEQQNMLNSIMGGKGLDALNGLDQENLNAMLRRMQGNNLDAAQNAAISSLLNKQGSVAAEMEALKRINASLEATTSASEIAAMHAQRASLEASLKKYEADLRTAMMAADDINRRNTTTLNNLKENLGLSGAEQHVARNAELLKDLERDYGIDLTGENAEAELNRFKQETYKKFYEADVNILKLNGSIDRDRLYSLSEAELARIGLTARERDLFASLQFGRLVDIKKIQQTLQRLAIRLQGAKNLAMTLVNQGIGQGEQEFLKATKYSMQAVKTARALAAASLKYQMATLRTVRVVGSKFIPGSIRNALPHIRMPLRNTAGAVRTSLAMAKQSVNQAIHYNPIARKTRLVKARLKDKVVGGIANSRVGRIFHNIGAAVSAPFKWAKKLRDFVKKVIGAVVGFLLGAASFLVAFECVYMLIGSLADAINGARLAIYNSLAPADYADTVAYQLYETLKDDEDTWINHLGNVQAAYNSRTDILYGENYMDYNTYIDLHPELALNGSDLYINPFFTKTGFKTQMVWREEDEAGTKGDFIDADSTTWKNNINTYLTKADTYDGINSMNIGSNDSYYTETDGKTYGGYVANIETGHTSNIKDILAMTDIMYQHEMDAFFDSCDAAPETSGILGGSPAQITYQNMSEKIHDLGWGWKAIIGGGGEENDASVWERLKAAHKEHEGATVSYNTVTSYAENLFNMSHQDQWFLDVDFFGCDFKKDPGTKKIITDASDDAKALVNDLNIGEGSVITIDAEHQADASHLHTCLNPVTNPFYMKYIKASSANGDMLVDTAGTHVYGTSGSYDASGRFTGNSSADFITDTGLFPVNVGMDNILEDKVYAGYAKNMADAIHPWITSLQSQLRSKIISYSDFNSFDSNDMIVDGFTNRINWKPDEYYFVPGHEFNASVLADPTATRVQNLQCLDDEWTDNAWEPYDPNKISQYTHITSGYCKCWTLNRPDKTHASPTELATLPEDKKYKGLIDNVEYLPDGTFNDGLDKNSGKSIFNWGQLVTKSLPDEHGVPNKQWDPTSNYSGPASYEYDVTVYKVANEDGSGTHIATPEELAMIENGEMGFVDSVAIKNDPDAQWGSTDELCTESSHGSSGSPKSQHHDKEVDVSSVDMNARKYFKEENLATITPATDSYYDSPEDAKIRLSYLLGQMIENGQMEEAIREAIKVNDPTTLTGSDANGGWYSAEDDTTDGVSWLCSFDEDRNEFTITYYETFFTMLNRMKFNNSEVDLWKSKASSTPTSFYVDPAKVKTDVRRPMLYRRLNVVIPGSLNACNSSDCTYALLPKNNLSANSTLSGGGIIAFYDYDSGTWKTNLMKYIDPTTGDEKIKVWSFNRHEDTAVPGTFYEKKMFYPYLYDKVRDINTTGSGSKTTIYNYEEFKYGLNAAGELNTSIRPNWNNLITLSDLEGAWTAVGVEVTKEGAGDFASIEKPDPTDPTIVLEYIPRTTTVKITDTDTFTVSVECVENTHTQTYAKLNVLPGENITVKDVYYAKSGLHSNTLDANGQIKHMSNGHEVIEYDGNVSLSPTKNYQYYANVLKPNDDGTYEFRWNQYDLVEKGIVINSATAASRGSIVLKYNMLETSPARRWSITYTKIAGFEKYKGKDYEGLVDAFLDFQGRGSDPDLYDKWDVKPENWINLRCYDPDTNTDYNYEKVPADFVKNTNAHDFDSRAHGQLYANTITKDIKDRWYTWTHEWISGHQERNVGGDGSVDYYWVDGHCQVGPAEEHEDVRYTEIDKDNSQELGCRYGAVWNQIVLCKKRIITYSRNCQGHLFSYCGGHVGVHAHGIVYSATNEQMTIAGVKDEEKIPKPLFDTHGTVFDVDTYMGSEIIGKINEETLDYSAGIGSYVASGCCAEGPETKQGSIWSTESRGPNLIVDGTGWGTDDGGMRTTKIKEKRGKLKDIFDVDMGISYGYNMFPLYGEWENYEGWTSGNMSMCMGKITADWGELYNFEIPLEIGDHIAKGTEKTYLSTGAYDPVVTPGVDGTNLDNVFFGTFAAAEDIKAGFVSAHSTDMATDPKNSGTSAGAVASTINFCKSFLKKIDNFVSATDTAINAPGTVYSGNKSYYSYHMFNIPLTQQDIEAIDIGLSEAYPSYKNDAERQEHVHRVLGLVGNANAENYMGKDMYKSDSSGKYSRSNLSHDEHGFLTYSQNPMNPSYGQEYSSTIGSEFSLIQYLMNAANPGTVKFPPNADTNTVIRRLESMGSNTSGYNALTKHWVAQPGDYIFTTTGLSGVRKYGPEAGSYDLGGLERLPVYGASPDPSQPGQISYDMETIKYYASPYHAAVFIGVFNKDIRLSSGQEISKGVPVYIDMTTLSKYINYSRALETVQQIPSDVVYTAYKAIANSEDDSISQEAMDILRSKSAYGIMEYTNGARSIGGVFLHGAVSSDYWFRKNRADAFWVWQYEVGPGGETSHPGVDVKFINYKG